MRDVFFILIFFTQLCVSQSLINNEDLRKTIIDTTSVEFVHFPPQVDLTTVNWGSPEDYDIEILENIDVTYQYQ